MLKIPFLNILASSGTFFIPSHCFKGDSEYRSRSEQFHSPRGHVVKGFCLLSAALWVEPRFLVRVVGAVEG